MNRPNAYVAALRNEYIAEPLNKEEVSPDPIEQFKRWFEESLEAKVTEPTAMNLSTCTKDGRPSGRIVLLKGFDEKGFVFYTNYDSRKGKDLKDNPFGALTIFWPELHRQVRIEGPVKKIKGKESETYFESRPRESQIGALASAQSDVITDRQVLENNFEKYTRKYQDRSVPRPKNWGGYVLQPVEIEFWQGRPNRLHDRILYEAGENGDWSLCRLAP